MKPHLISVEGIVKLVHELGFGMCYSRYVGKTLRQRGNPHSEDAVRSVLSKAVAAGYLTRAARPNGPYGYRFTLTEAGKALIAGAGE